MARGFDPLALLCSLFDTIEINSSFYRTPSPRLTRDWSRRVAGNPRFAFTAKVFRGFTHEGNAGDADAREFLAAMEPLANGGRLGCALLQFPIRFRNTPENRRYLERLLSRFASLSLAAEFRHASWNDPAARQILAERGAAFVNIDQPLLKENLPATGHVTASLAYYRFHGRNAAKWFGPDTSREERYDYLYSGEELEPWAKRIREGTRTLAKAARRATDPARGVYAILNNHFRGQAVANAIQLQNLLTGAVAVAPARLVETYPTLAGITRPMPPLGQKSLF